MSTATKVLDNICWTPSYKTLVSHRHVGDGRTLCGRTIDGYSSGEEGDYGSVTCKPCISAEALA